jgi:hypothetical protein
MLKTNSSLIEKEIDGLHRELKEIIRIFIEHHKTLNDILIQKENLINSVDEVVGLTSSHKSRAFTLYNDVINLKEQNEKAVEENEKFKI